MAPNDGKIYSATYSNVPVYELTVDNNHVMRRRSDDWINATHILKVADYDKPARTRILEREVQKGVHEKVQGGYGKYQGTWIPLPDGRELAIKNNVYDKLQPMFEYVPGDRSPPPAPKHATAASSKPRAQRAPAQPRRSAANAQVHRDYDHMDTSMREDATPDDVTVLSESAYDEYDNSNYPGSRKRRRVEDQMTQADREHQLWADELLDYFMLQDSPLDSIPNPPDPPANANLNRPIDDKGHTALHWAAAMGDLAVVRDLIQRGAKIDAQSKSGETPLMRAVIFVNAFDKQNMDKLAALFVRTVNMQDWFGSTVFHQIAHTTEKKSKYPCARYYMDSVLIRMAEILDPPSIERILNAQDQNGDTAITIAARHGARKCVRSLIGCNAAVDIGNTAGETADQLIVQLNNRRKERESNRQLSSSPFQADGGHHHATGGAVQAPGIFANGLPFEPYSHALDGTSSTPNGVPEVYRSEAALALTSHIMPTINTKFKSLASNLDQEIAEKEAERAEAQRVMELKSSQIETLRREREKYEVQERERLARATAVVSDEELERELEDLEKECLDLVEREQAWGLKELLEKEKAIGNESTAIDDEADDDDDDDVNMADGVVGTSSSTPDLSKKKTSLTRALISAHKKRIDLVHQIVAHLGVAGVWDAPTDRNGGDEAANRQSQYRALITGCLGVSDADVEGLLPDIVAELEEARGIDGV